MSKADLINRVHNMASTANPGITKAVVQTVLDAFITEATAVLSEGGEVALPPLGKFETRERAGRTGRNPQTGAAITIAGRRVVAFKPAKPLKDAVDKA
ncbi:HU family DNA-binding protein [Chitinimonas sp.]|uniref:HU family DNA-binding protein n=1 Tax=Chitinimonas sp. TaxID=1934313 RepID=UPI0035AD7D90